MMVNLQLVTVVGCLLIGLAVQAQEPEEISLYSGTIPNARDVPNPERVEQRSGKAGRAFWDTALPTLTIFLPDAPNGKAVIICPGGGYAKTAFDKEGIHIAQSLVKDSITAFVLKYRIPQDLTNLDKSIAPLQDAQQAIRHVRKHAIKYRIQPNKIGIMGFSAGGHLAASAATHFQEVADPNERDSISVRPDFVALIYPVVSFTDSLTHNGSRNRLLGDRPSEADIRYWSNELQIGFESPPAFLVHAADDKAVPVGNSLAYYRACIAKGVLVEMHLYPKGGHGFGIDNPTTEDDWIDRFKNWIKGL